MKTFQKRWFVSLIVPLVLLTAVLWGPLTTGGSVHLTDSIQGIQYVMAKPGNINIEQPDGTRLTVNLYGDEVVNFARTPDGYTILRGDDGVYYFAEMNKKGDMVPSSHQAFNSEKRGKRENRFLKTIEKNLFFSKNQINKMRASWPKRKAGKPVGLKEAKFSGGFPSTGTRNMLVILANFTDKSFVKSNNDFNNIMNVGSDSFKAYYSDNSYGSLVINTTVVGPYNINMTMQAADNNTRDYIARCVDAAEAAGVNFANFDNNNDGQMDSLYVIHAGYGEEAGAPSYTIWSHSWTLYNYARTYDGVTIDSYATSPELRDSYGSSITAIGVIVHEMGHNLGAPDYYDTDDGGSGGSSWDLKNWDVMSSGSWNNNGDTPAQHNMFTKTQYGWTTPIVLNSASTVSLNHTLTENKAYRINTTTSNEYFILENRQQAGWDSYIGGHGMLIFHIDGNYINSAGNEVNANPSHQGVDLEEADNIRSTATFSGDPFPGASNKTSFTDSTTPSSKSWAGANTNVPLTNISESGGVVTFDVMGGGSGTSITANFTYTVNNLAVSFADTSTASGTSVTTWSWNFGDGAYSTAQNPAHTYAAAGTYTVTLTASDGGSTSDSVSRSVTVTSGGGLVYCTAQGNNNQYEWIAGVSVGSLNNTSNASGYSDFTAQTANLTAGGSVNVNLTPGFAGTGYSEYWKVWIDYNIDGDFDDAGEEVYSGSGSSAVSGTFTVPSGASGITRMRIVMRYNAAPSSCGAFDYGEVEDYTVNISAATVNPPVANFTASSTTITAGQSVTFTDTSTNNPTGWSWSFNGGTPSSSTSQNPTVTYNTAGTYSVSLTASNSAGSNTNTKANYITVNPVTVSYCSLSSTDWSYEWIAGIQIGSINNTSGGSGYSDYTGLSTNLTRGAAYNITLTPGFSSSSYDEYWTVWIDYNGDGDFADAGEEAFKGYGSGGGTVSFTVPSTAVTGATRMRIGMQYNEYLTSSCGSFSYGEVEDYTVNIQ
jgi:M6 family metalloprotease-like protein